jgi:hypothetical protein
VRCGIGLMGRTRPSLGVTASIGEALAPCFGGGASTLYGF